jgi:hypothetical protein
MNNFILKLGAWLGVKETVFSQEISRQLILEICMILVALVYLLK